MLGRSTDSGTLDNVVDLRIIGETTSFKTILLSRVLTKGSRNVWGSESIDKDRSIVSLLNLLGKPLKHSFPGLTDSRSRVEEEVLHLRRPVPDQSGTENNTENLFSNLAVVSLDTSVKNFATRVT